MARRIDRTRTDAAKARTLGRRSSRRTKSAAALMLALYAF